MLELMNEFVHAQVKIVDVKKLSGGADDFSSERVSCISLFHDNTFIIITKQSL